jgi:hypothetical protein
MKKVLMVIFVLSLLGLLAAPVLADVLADSGPDCLIGPNPKPPSTFRSAGVEDPVQIAGGGGFRSRAPLG